MRLHKKSMVEIGMLQLIGIILGLVLIVSTAYFFSSFSSIFGGRQEEQGTLSNFKTLVGAINELNKLHETCAYIKAHPFFIASNFILVGFNKDRAFVEDKCQPEVVYKPEIGACSDTACLCLYPDKPRTDDDFAEGSSQITCEPVDADYIFTREYYGLDSSTMVSSKPYLRYDAPENVYKNILGGAWGPVPVFGPALYPDFYSYFFIYGACGDWGLNKEFRSAPLYIEVMRSPTANMVTVFIAHSTPELIQQRQDAFAANKISCKEYY